MPVKKRKPRPPRKPLDPKIQAVVDEMLIAFNLVRDPLPETPELNEHALRVVRRFCSGQAVGDTLSSGLRAAARRGKD